MFAMGCDGMNVDKNCGSPQTSGAFQVRLDWANERCAASGKKLAGMKCVEGVDKTVVP